jgi:hypothetical protein
MDSRVREGDGISDSVIRGREGDGISDSVIRASATATEFLDSVIPAEAGIHPKWRHDAADRSTFQRLAASNDL